MVSNLLVAEVAQYQMVVFVHLSKRLFWVTTTGLDRMICVIALNFDLISLPTMCVRVFVCRTASYPLAHPLTFPPYFPCRESQWGKQSFSNYISLSVFTHSKWSLCLLSLPISNIWIWWFSHVTNLWLSVLHSFIAVVFYNLQVVEDGTTEPSLQHCCFAALISLNGELEPPQQNWLDLCGLGVFDVATWTKASPTPFTDDPGRLYEPLHCSSGVQPVLDQNKW